MGILDHLTYFLRNLYVSLEAIASTLYGTTDQIKTEKEWQSCISSPCLFNLYTDHIMQNARLNEQQARIKIPGRNNNRKYANDTTLIAENEEEQRNSWWGCKRRVKKFAYNWILNNNNNNKQANYNCVIWSHHFMANRRGKRGSSDKFLLWGL